jgi:hypothetical protein
LTKLTVFSIILEKNPDQDLHKNKSAYFAHPDLSAAKLGKKKCANYASKYGTSLGDFVVVRPCTSQN